MTDPFGTIGFGILVDLEVYRPLQPWEPWGTDSGLVHFPGQCWRALVLGHNVWAIGANVENLEAVGLVQKEAAGNHLNSSVSVF